MLRNRSLRLQLALTYAGIALLSAALLGGILFGYLSDRFGRRRVMTWTIGLYSLGTALTATATGPGTLLLFRLLTGLGVGGEWAVGHALLAEGRSNLQIARELHLTENTVKFHLRNIYAKLGVANRTEAAARYHKRA